jgi:hypothetical protein
MKHTYTRDREMNNREIPHRLSWFSQKFTGSSTKLSPDPVLQSETFSPEFPGKEEASV